jgi:hypothetical protein
LLSALEDATAYFQKMTESASRSEQTEFELSLRAFLAATRSIPDHLLEEYNVKFGFNIPLLDRNFRNSFCQKVIADPHKQVKDFLSFWDRQMKTIQDDPHNPVNLLWSKRNIQIHRVSVRPDLVKVGVIETLTISDSVRVEKYNVQGELVGVSVSPPTPHEQSSSIPATIDWYFKDHDSEPILVLSEKALVVLKSFVDEAHTRFP